MTATAAASSAPATGAAGSAGGGRGRSVLPWLGLAAVVLLIAAAAGSPEGSRRPLDPASTRPDGARGLVQLLESFGADVRIGRGSPVDADDIALVLSDRLGVDDAAQTLAWARAGGTLVVADSASGLLPVEQERPRCAEPALDGVAELRVPLFAGGGADEPTDVDVPRGDDCFASIVDARSLGDGNLVRVSGDVGDPLGLDGLPVDSLFSNRLLDEADNAVLAVALLAPVDGERVVVLDGPSPGSGEQSLLSLLPRSVRQAGLQLAVVGLLVVLWRGRRLGRPVAEPQPVAVAGSELVAAVGRLLDAQHRPHAAAERLRADTRRLVHQRLGLPPGAPVAAVAAAVAARTGLPADDVAGALATTPVTTDSELVDVAARLDRIRTLVVGREEPARVRS